MHGGSDNWQMESVQCTYGPAGQRRGWASGLDKITKNILFARLLCFNFIHFIRISQSTILRQSPQNHPGQLFKCSGLDVPAEPAGFLSAAQKFAFFNESSRWFSYPLTSEEYSFKGDWFSNISVHLNHPRSFNNTNMSWPRSTTCDSDPQPGLRLATLGKEKCLTCR